MELRKFRKQLSRYLKGTSNETETAVIEAWYKSYQDKDNQQLATDENRHKIKQAMYQNIAVGINPSPALSWFNYRIAASILIICVLSILSYYVIKPASVVKPTYITMQTHAGQVKQFYLPDSSVLWLNAQSTIRVPSNFNDKIREVYLDEGEAFFIVKHNTHKPFKVNTVPLQVQVLGTSFNINAYRHLPHLRITVLTGKVGVSRGKNLLAFLTPGQELTYLPADATFNTQAVNAHNTQSWKDGDTYLNHIRFDELSLVVKNLYGLTLSTTDKRIHNYRFTLRIKQNIPAGETLKLISQIHNTHFRKEGGNVTIY